MGRGVVLIMEALLERLCDLEDEDPCLYLIEKERLRWLCAAYRADPQLTVTRVIEKLTEDE